jgi:ankyrin repeat protein
MAAPARSSRSNPNLLDENHINNNVNDDDCSYEKSEDSKQCLVLLKNAYDANNLDLVNEIIEDMVSKSLVSGLKKLHTACGYGFHELVEKYLTEEPKIDPNSECSFNELFGITPLHFCAGIGPDSVTQNRDKCIELLVKHGANLNHMTSRHDSALHWATKLADLSVCKKLVESGILINKINLDNCTAAHGAAFYKNLDILEMLIDNKIDVKVKDISGKNILHLLCKESPDDSKISDNKEKSAKLVSLVNRLIDELGLDPDEKDSNEFTAFMYACEHQNLDLIQTLIDHKANLNYTSSEGINAMLLAIVNSCSKVVKKLIDSGFDLVGTSKSINCSYVTDAAYLNDIEILSILVDQGHCDINETKEDENGVILNPLWAACERSNLNIVEFLLTRGARTIIRPDLNMTAMHCAAMAQYESLSVAKLLVEQKCPINLRSTQAGETPLFLAINSGYFEFVEYLLSLGVDPNNSSPNSRTCFQQAIFRGHKEIIILLLNKGYRLTEEDYKDLYLYVMDLYQDNDTEMLSFLIGVNLITKEKCIESIENFHKWQTKQENDRENVVEDERPVATPSNLRLDFDSCSNVNYPKTVDELDKYLSTKLSLSDDQQSDNEE